MAPLSARLRISKALNATNELGISEDKVKPVLKNLLKVYDKNWAPIEDDNYRVLIDAIFEEEEQNTSVSKPNRSEQGDHGRNLEEESIEHEEVEQPLKRRMKSQATAGSSLSITDFKSDRPLLKRPKVEEEYDVTPSQQPPQVLAVVNKGKQLVSQFPKHYSRRASKTLRINDHEQGIIALPTQKINNTLAVVDDNDIVPVAVIHPESSFGNTLEGTPAGPANREARLDIASSPLGEVKLSFSCGSDIANFHMPTFDELRKSMEEKCLRSYKILDPSFSFTNMMQDMCQTFLELATSSSRESYDPLMNPTPTLDHALGDGDKLISACIQSPASNKSTEIPIIPLRHDNILDHDNQMTKEIIENGHVGSSDKKECKNLDFISSDLNLDEVRSIYDVNDITKGEERVEISWVNEITDEWLPYFHYIPQNIVFNNASVNFPLSRIGETDCCSTCIGGCLSATGSCACARENGGGFAYTSEGLLKEEVLNEGISMTLKNRNYQFCKECPIIKSKGGDVLGACDGHVERKLIKECWKKCSCVKQCGNRVVQRGITHKLQVFYTPDGKGWGLRTLDKIPKGAFVCEFVGEILTVKELIERKQENTDSEKYSCPVLLDAFWVPKGVPKDEEALCLEATGYGNVARYINHRCFDANLIEIPVEIETPDYHYYHVAFFTTREVDALEELTWDYGIQFDNRDDLVKAFRCECGSKSCRNMKRLNRSKHSVAR